MRISDTIGSLLRSRGSNKILSIAPEQSVYEALEMMAQYDVGALLVISNDELVGIFSERDYARKVILKGKASRETYVWEIMSQPVICVQLEFTVEQTMALMTEKRVRHLPVVGGGKVVAVVSIRDLLGEAVQHHAKVIAELERERLTLFTSMA